MTEIRVLAPGNVVLNDVLNSDSIDPFDASIEKFLNSLSSQILTNKECKSYPELIALGFWLRASNIESLKLQNLRKASKPLGLVLHFTPANVDTMFMYSWVCSLLMGNRNIVRVASHESPMQTALLMLLDELFHQAEYLHLAKMNTFVRFDKNSGYSEELSLLADARVIWGGDESVNAIRSLPCQPRSRDISFADRYSACLINGDNLDNIDELIKLAESLWRDTKPFSQQACSSPRIIYWTGDTSQKHALFSAVNKIAQGTPPAVELANNHLVLSQLVRSSQPDCQTIIIDRVGAVEVDDPTLVNLEWHTGDGFYIVHQIDELDDLPSRLEEKLQTLGYWNIPQKQILKLSEQSSIRGLDRIVPVGRALEFSPIWDGFDLFSQLSRHVDVIF